MFSNCRSGLVVASVVRLKRIAGRMRMTAVYEPFLVLPIMTPRSSPPNAAWPNSMSSASPARPCCATTPPPSCASVQAELLVVEVGRGAGRGGAQHADLSRQQRALGLEPG